ncbi:hypothetical protein ONZ51_g8162 [Trametes cubensis]|uniref:Uncharacterized protein n=1 Tax=Trametes cubensis TaxID=1111947 RepID=A0AAD7TQS6_9APHY|nr:hypothetical protein ONZ51_g8162 [Trametes cubensis]
MSSVTASIPLVSVFRHPAHFPSAVWDSLASQPRRSNILYAHAAKLATVAPNTQLNHSQDLWIVSWVSQPESTVAFVVACTTGPIAPYPIFIYTPLPISSLASSFVQLHMNAVIQTLRLHMRPERIFSAFGSERVVEVFASAWTKETGVQLSNPSVYYHAKLMFCTTATLKAGRQHLVADGAVRMRAAVAADVEKLARLCHGFAAGSEPFVLTPAQAYQEAKSMIQNRQAWVCAVGGQEQGAEIALLRVKESVVLYVAHNNPGAENVYRRVGFADSTDPAGTLETWKEIGFDRNAVQLGHW